MIFITAILKYGAKMAGNFKEKAWHTYCAHRHFIKNLTLTLTLILTLTLNQTYHCNNKNPKMSDVTGIFVYLTAHIPCTKSFQISE